MAKKTKESPQKIEMSALETSVLLRMCAMGKGLTYAASKIGKSSERITEILKADPAIEQSVQNAMLEGMSELLDRYSKIMQEQRIADGQMLESKIESFISNIVYWDSFGVDEDSRTGDEIIMRVREHGFNLYEVATGFGMLYHELLEIVSDNPELSLKILKEDERI